MDVKGIVVSIDAGANFKFYPRPAGTGDFDVPGISDEAAPYVAMAVGSPFEGSTLPALKAPTRVSDPTMTGTGTIGSTFTRQSPGVVTANPEATMDPPLWQMRADDLSAAQTIAGASGETFTVDDATFDVGNQIRTGTRFVNSQGEITLWSSWITVAEVPKITAVVDLQPATQVSSVSFNIAIKGSPTITQGQTIIASTQVAGTETWEFVAQVEGPLSITANQDGYQAFSANLTVSPPPADFVAIDNVPVLRNMTEAAQITHTEPAWLGTITASTATGAGPSLSKAAAIEGTSAVGQTLTFRPPLLVSEFGPSDVAFTRDPWPDASAGDTYVVRSQDAGTTFDIGWTATDPLGTISGTSNAVSIPAAALPADTFSTAATNINGQTTESGETWAMVTSTGQVEAVGGVLVSRASSTYRRGAADRGPAQYVECDLKVGTTPGLGVYPAVRIIANPVDATRRRALYVFLTTTQVVLRYRNESGGEAAVTGGSWTYPTDGTWAAGTIHRIGLGITTGNLATVYVDGVARIIDKAFTNIASGGTGIMSEGNAGSGNTTVDNLIIREAR